MIGDEDNLVAYVNDAAVRLHGYDAAAEMLGRPLDRFLDAVEHRVLPAVVPTHDDPCGRWVGQATGRRKDGTTFVLEASISRLPDGCLVAIGRDVTARVAADAALRASEERHRLVAGVTREVIWDADLLTGRTTWSGAVRDVFGLPQDEVQIDLAWWRSRIHPDDVSRVIAARDAALSSSSDQFSDEYRLRDHAGRYVTVLARGRILRDGHGRATRFLGSMLDITELRRQEEELRLARRVAEEANEAKSIFLANMSHELRTPLTTVIAGTEMVMDSPLSPPQLRLLERVGRSGERLLRLVDDLLDFSAIERGDVRMDEAPFDPATVVEHVAAWARAACRDRQLDFQLTTAALPHQLLGDPNRLGQVLTNLLGNAVKFTSSGSVRLDVAATGDHTDGTRLRFTVQDTGIGIDPEHHISVFKSFQQADPSITRRYGGNGLGLAISKELVETMGGWIGVDSEPGHGSRFYFEVPFGRPETGITETQSLS
jgi:PAS domain S-box-containing protein